MSTFHAVFFYTTRLFSTTNVGCYHRTTATEVPIHHSAMRTDHVTSVRPCTQAVAQPHSCSTHPRQPAQTQQQHTNTNGRRKECVRMPHTARAGPSEQTHRTCTDAPALAPAPAAAPVDRPAAQPLLPLLPPLLHAWTGDGPCPAAQHHTRSDARALCWRCGCPMSRRSGVRDDRRGEHDASTVAAFTCQHRASVSQMH